MGAKRISEHDLVFTGRKFLVGDRTGKRYRYTTLKNGILSGVLDFGYAIPCGEGKQHRYYCPDRVVYLKTGYFNPKPQPDQ